MPCLVFLATVVCSVYVWKSWMTLYPAGEKKKLRFLSAATEEFDNIDLFNSLAAEGM